MSEREQFEKAMRSHAVDDKIHFGRYTDDTYAYPGMENLWQGWQARARIAEQREATLNESEPQSRAAVKAEALREFSNHLMRCCQNERANGYPESAKGTEKSAQEALDEADRIEREAKENK